MTSTRAAQSFRRPVRSASASITNVTTSSPASPRAIVTDVVESGCATADCAASTSASATAAMPAPMVRGITCA